ncbi:MAG: efflux RND transporter periplasmic adaptor subunit [Chthoniobacteraceae bacterium]
MKISRLHLAATLCGGLFFLVGCRKPPQPAVFPPAEVTVSKPIARRLLEWDEYIGRLEAVESVEVRARVSGYLQNVHFQEGREVQKGDLLCVIDPSTYQAEVARATADVARAQAAADLAASEAKRAESLVRSKTIAAEEFDTKAQAKAQAAASLLSAKAALDAANLQLGFTRITAAISGRIGRKLVTEGNLITGGASGATLLTTIVSMDPIHAHSDVDENAALRYRQLASKGKRVSGVDHVIPAELELPGESAWPHKGGVDFVDNRVDPATGTVHARAVFANADRLLAPGYFVRLRVPGSGEYDALLVAQEAVLSDQAAKLVMVIGKDNIPEPRPVQLGPVIDGLRVIREGIGPDDRIVVVGLAKVRPGVPVKPDDQPMPVPAVAEQKQAAN